MNKSYFFNHKRPYRISDTTGARFVWKWPTFDLANDIVLEHLRDKERKERIAQRSTPSFVADAQRRKILQKFDRALVSADKNEDQLMRHLAEILEDYIIADLNMSPSVKIASLNDVVKALIKFGPYIDILAQYSANQTLVGQARFTLLENFFSSLMLKCNTFALVAPAHSLARTKLPLSRFSSTELSHIKYIIEENNAQNSEWYQRMYAESLDSISAKKLQMPKINEKEILELSEEDEQEFIQIENEIHAIQQDRINAAITLKDDVVNGFIAEMSEPNSSISKKEIISGYNSHVKLIKQITASKVMGNINLYDELKKGLKSGAYKLRQDNTQEV